MANGSAGKANLRERKNLGMGYKVSVLELGQVHHHKCLFSLHMATELTERTETYHVHSSLP